MKTQLMEHPQNDNQLDSWKKRLEGERLASLIIINETQSD